MFIDWNVAGDFVPVVQDVVDRVHSGADRVSDVIMDVPAFLDGVSESDLTFFDPGQVVDFLAAYGCRDQIGSYLRRLGGGLQSTGTVRTDGSAILAAARRKLAGKVQTRHNVTAAELVEALNRAECSHLLAEPLPGRAARLASRRPEAICGEPDDVGVDRDLDDGVAGAVAWPDGADGEHVG
jgi:hypothetical protein